MSLIAATDLKVKVIIAEILTAASQLLLLWLLISTANPSMH